VQGADSDIHTINTNIGLPPICLVSAFTGFYVCVCAEFYDAFFWQGLVTGFFFIHLKELNDDKCNIVMCTVRVQTVLLG